MSRGAKIAMVVVAVALAWTFWPALAGYHIGYSTATRDNVCRSDVFQWCKYDSTRDPNSPNYNPP